MKRQFWPGRVLAIWLLVIVGALGAAGTAYECTCGKGPSNEQLETAPERVEDGSLLGLRVNEIEDLFGRPTKGAIIAWLGLRIFPREGRRMYRQSLACAQLR